MHHSCAYVVVSWLFRVLPPMSHQVSGGWSFYRVAPIYDMIILKSQYRICFAVGDWPPFATQEPTSPPCSVALHCTSCVLHH